MDRRRFLQAGATIGIGAAVAGSPVAAALGKGPSANPAPPLGRAYVPVPAFPSGILSGDPAADSVILWTRLDPAMADRGLEVTWEIGTDPALDPSTVVASGRATTAPATDHTVRVEAAGLAAGTTYWYRFSAAGSVSPIGRTRTLPADGVEALRIAYFSCQRYVHGYFNAHADLAARALDPATDVDLVICLGDYVYEAGPADDVAVPGRTDPEAPSVTLDDFRRQYHLYRSDPDLQGMHAAFPFVGIFDNHDGFSQPSDPAGPGARSAFFEQMPVRLAGDDPLRQYRSFALGDLCELFLLDERQYRDPTLDGGDNPLGSTSLQEPLMVDPERTMLGPAQREWLAAGLAASTATWKILGSQLVFAPLRSERLPAEQAAAAGGPQRNAGRFVNLIGWDGYQAERRALVDHIHDSAISDVMVISGDSHFWSASELPRDWDDPASTPVLVEFAGSSVTSANAGEMPGLPGNDLIRPVVAAANPLHLRYIEVATHGYGLIELSPGRASVSYVTVPITSRGSAASTLTRFEVDQGTALLRQVEGDGLLLRSVPAPAPTLGGTGSVPDTAPEAVAPASPAVPVGAPARFTG